MKRFLKIISLITAFVLVLTCFYGCGAEKAEALDFPLDGDAYALMIQTVFPCTTRHFLRRKTVHIISTARILHRQKAVI